MSIEWHQRSWHNFQASESTTAVGNSSQLADFEDTAAALRLLRGTRNLLRNGQRWRPQVPASDQQKLSCNPLSNHAFYFDLGGAATHVRWQMRSERQGAQFSSNHVQRLSTTLLSFAQDYRDGQGGWLFACSLLDGLEEALEQYRAAPLPESELLPQERRKLQDRPNPQAGSPSAFHSVPFFIKHALFN